MWRLQRRNASRRRKTKRKNKKFDKGIDHIFENLYGRKFNTKFREVITDEQRQQWRKTVEEQENIAIKQIEQENEEVSQPDEYEKVEGVLEVMPDGYGFIRGENYLPTNKDVYVSPVQIRRFKLDTGDKVKGIKRTPKEGERFPALIFVGEVNGEHPEKAMKRKCV